MADPSATAPPSWATSPVLLVVAGGLTALLTAGALLTALSGDPADALMFGLGALGIGVFTAHGTVLRPRLTADLTGLRARTMGGTVELGWSQARVRLRTTRRLGRDSVTLEVESGDHLLVLGWLELGEDPRDVLDVLSALRART